LFFYISIYKGKLLLPVYVLSPDRVRVALPLNASPLELRREGDGWVITGRSQTPARTAVIEAWDAVSKEHATLIQERTMKSQADPYVFFVDEHNRLYRVTKTQANRLCNDVIKAGVEPPNIDLAKYRAVEIGPAPIYLDVFNVPAAKLMVDHDLTPRSKSETKRQTTLRVVNPPVEEPTPTK
jgi:hypothetical protein